MKFKKIAVSILSCSNPGRALLARRKAHQAQQRVFQLAKYFRLTQEEVLQGENSSERQRELVEQQIRKFPDKGEDLNGRIDWLKNSPLNTGTIDTEKYRTAMQFHYFAYGFTPGEFLAYQLYEKSDEDRRKYISDRDSVEYGHRLNEINALRLLFDKNKTYDKFREYFKRDAVPIINGEDFQRYLLFLSDHPIFVKKDAKESCGRGLEIVNTLHFSEQDKEQLFQEYLENGNIILEERIIQSEYLAKINTSTVNTVRCFTLLTRHGVLVPWCFGKLGRAGYFVDNGAAGGLLSGINVEIGRIIPGSCCDEFGQRYHTHPDNGLPLDYFQYPDWDEMKEICKEMALQIPEAKWIGWDMAHTDKGWVVVEGNSVSEVIGPQSTLQRGIREEMVQYLKDVDTVY